jgi:hypothetical protein
MPVRDSFRVSRKRLLRLMREPALLSPHRARRKGDHRRASRCDPRLRRPLQRGMADRKERLSPLDTRAAHLDTNLRRAA